MADIKVISLNTRGIGQGDNGRKRRTIFRWLKQRKPCIWLLQETHTNLNSEKIWKNELGKNYEVVFSHGTKNSRGVAIILPIALNYQIDEIDIDNDGRSLILTIQKENIKYTIINVYAPTKDHNIEQMNFINTLITKIRKYNTQNLIIGGDFNTVLNPDIDKSGGITAEKQSDYAQKILEMMEEFNIVDVWRILNPNTKRFTRRQTNPLIQSRIDYFLISANLLNLIENCNIEPSIKSDHSLISIDFKGYQEWQRGRGFWKFNNQLLHDSTYINKIETLISKTVTENKNMENKGLLWDFIKCEIRKETISYSIRKAKDNKLKLKQLTENIRKLEEELDKDPSQDILEQYTIDKHELECIHESYTAGAMLRSKAQWVEQGEKNTQYFLNLEKRNYNQKCIRKITDNNTDYITKPNEIMNKIKEYYQDLYSNKSNENVKLEESSFLEQNEVKTISEESAESLDVEIGLTDCSYALKQLPNGKSPGSDGFTVEFYKFFWKSIKTQVFDSLKYALANGELSTEQKRGIITLIPKPDKDSRNIKNWRPITLLNTDYKILTKLLAIRLQKCIKEIIHPDQTGYVKGRYIGYNIRLINDIITNYERSNENASILFLDYQKAFDSIKWDFINKALNKFGFGNNFTRWIEALYKNTESCVINNGHSTGFFKLERGIRQGCPISALLFIIAIETFAIKLRNSTNIAGLVINGTEIKISQLADDTTLFLKDNNSIKNALELVNMFSKCSGLKLNKDKTEAMRLGSRTKQTENGFGLKWSGKVKSLGIVFEKDNEKMIINNFEARIKKMITILNIWYQRDLSLKGKISIIKSLIMPQILYVASVLEVPEWAVNKIKNIILEFIWSKKPAKVKYTTIIGKIEKGGLKLPDIDSMVRAIKCVWMKRLIDESDGSWKTYIKSFFKEGNITDFIQYRYEYNDIDQTMPLFYKQIFISYMEIQKEPTTYDEIQREIIWNNRFIKIDNKKIQYKEWIEKGIFFINDIIDNVGNLLQEDELCNRYQIRNLNFLTYFSLRSAIPYQWKQTLRNKPKSNSDHFIKEPSITIGNQCIRVEYLTCANIYWKYIDMKYQQPTCWTRWANIYNKQSDYWPAIYKLPYKISRETKLQTFQYKIINRIFACNQKLEKWKIKESNICSFCNHEDDIEHYFIACIKCIPFWNSFKRWWKYYFEDELLLNNTDIIFGNISFPKTLNYCILLAKWFIFRQKHYNRDSDNIFFPLYLLELKHKLIVEKHIAVKNKTTHVFNQTWLALYETLH